MTESANYIGVDWGTSRMRAALCEFDGNDSVLIENLDGPGVREAQDAIEETLFRVISPWIDRHGPLPVLSAGMVGSNIGWRMTPYLPCPIPISEISRHCTVFATRGCDIVIVPGLECINSFGEADSMRSEELQLLGWVSAEPARMSGAHFVCLPGTHTKWVSMKDGRVQHFQTAVTGELYALSRDHSILLTRFGDGGVDGMPAGEDAFLAGVAACREAKGALSHAMYSARSRILKRRLGVDAAASFLSGVLVAADVMGAMDLMDDFPARVTVVGEPALSEQFAAALRSFGVATEQMDGFDAAVQGFSVVYRDLYVRGGRRTALA